jgi:zinc protease
MAAEDNAWTWLDETVYHVTLAAPNLPRLIEMEADRFQGLVLTADDVQREAGAVYGEFRKSQADPDSRLWQMLYETAFTTHTYHHDTLGYEADIADMPTAHPYALSFFDRYYRPEYATILVVGDVVPDDVFAHVDAAYGDWERATVPPPAIPEEPVQEEARRAHIAWESPTATLLTMGWKIPGHDPDSPDVAALELAGNLLFSEVGPIHRRLVEEEGLAYRVTGGRDEFVDDCLFQVSVTLQENDALARAETVIREELAALADGVDVDLLERTRSHVRYGFLTGLTDPDSVAEQLGWYMRRGGSPDAIDRFYDHFDSITADDVSSVVRRYLVDAGLTVVTLTHEAPTSDETAETVGDDTSEGGE